ncbi:probable protein phosphatase 2C 66 [Cryptomeria japonica]|uniref:probable protein phosphatase 2C 66 n=1 Tax=Cryptomeria japonica TaxID=3369 RepID=UPI0027D9D274|nr:probable protein phosphatase 2C 66 [Cryptomeria japonica]XP_057815040.2 probable protein phosphatase 2C 66 [Cryptomeria japonica]XP_057815041.2 probable protein phosphatase 2C 66 [Cryptomeria japonica]
MGSCLSTEGSGCCKPRGPKKGAFGQASVTEARIDEELGKIAGRMCTSGSSSVACMFTQQGKKGLNQDSMIVWEDFASRKDTVFCGVFDGHGPFGHLVAKRVRDSLPSKLCSQWEAAKARAEEANSIDMNGSVGSMNSDETASLTMDEEWKESEELEGLEKTPEMFAAWKESFLKAFKVMDKELRLHPTVDCFCSGTTAVTLVKQGEDLVMGNVGDSRAVLGTRDENDTLMAVQLTVDLKPNLPKESERIKQFKGRVFALQDEPDVPRVWLPHDDSPGLAMARAFGDFCLKDFGLISVPEISYRRLTERDEFIVMATDGIWDVLSNKEVVEIVASAPTRTTAARSLVEFAVRAWRAKYPTSKTDDCAVVCLYLRDSPIVHEAKAKKDTLQDFTPMKDNIAVTVTVSEDKCPEDQEASSPTLGRQNTVRTANCVKSHPENAEIVELSTELKHPERSQSRRSLADCLSVADDEEWSALEGVTRVNSLLTLPRFLTGDRTAGVLRKRH